MTKEEVLSEIKDLLRQINNEDFVSLWNKLFKEEVIEGVDKDSREDLEDLFLEELGYFEHSKNVKIYKYLSLKV